MLWRRRGSREQDLDRELQVHLQLEAEELQERGVAPEEAQYAARRALGNVTATKEEVRRMWGWNTWEIFHAEIRYALRNIRRSPGFATMVVLTLMLGIGASTVVFTLVDTVLLKPLTYAESGQLAVAWEHVRFLGRDDAVGPNPRHVDVWQSRSTAVSAFTVFRHSQMGLATGGDGTRLTGVVHCLPNLFDVLRVRPLLGRTFVARDGTKGGDNVAVLTHAAWQHLFQSDAGVIGRTVRIDDNPVQIVGVLPADFHFPSANTLRPFSSRQPRAGLPEPSVFLPAVFNYAEMEWNGNYGNWTTVGRLKPGIRIEEAESQLNTILQQLSEEVMQGSRNQAMGALRASMQPMQEGVVGASGATLWFLMAAVLGLMLIACLNLANAQLGRALARGRDAALRTALGAAKWRLLWNGLAENVVLAAAGGIGGVLVAGTALELVRRQSAIDLPRLSEVRLNGAVLLFAVALTMMVSLLSGLVPALRILRADPHVFLQGGGGRTSFGSSSHTRLRTWIIGLQVFGCTVLLLVTGLFTKSLLHLLHQDKGFESHDAAIAEVKLPVKLFSAPEARVEFIDRTLLHVRALPGVEAAGLVSATPLEGESWIEPLRRADRPEAEGTMVNARWVSPGYFEATRQRLIAGRFFEERDRNLDSAVISEGAAKALWGEANPVGNAVDVLGRRHSVIGVVADSRMTSLKTAPVKTAYVHYKYRPPMTTSFVVRGKGGAEGFVTGLRQAIWSSAPNVTIGRVKTLDSQLSDSVARERLQMQVLVSFGAAALLLAMLGIYGTLSYSVAMRRQEIGIRMALGASKGRVYGQTLGQAAVPVGVGLVMGLAASLVAGGAIRSYLYGVDGMDGWVMVVVVGLFLIAGGVAAFVPARRAASVNPIDALRAE
ncbi:MAG: ABC transporter permease [Acidobacteria bacterium]|nr:ABC transporter permease [Acidobacteriota bacterium]